MAMWKCGLCVGFAALLLRQMLGHIHQVHSGDEEFEITCGISNCEKKYKSSTNSVVPAASHHTLAKLTEPFRPEHVNTL